jgi:hypothetical protein
MNVYLKKYKTKIIKEYILQKTIKKKNMSELLNSFYRLPVINVICYILLILLFFVLSILKILQAQKRACSISLFNFLFHFISK